MIADTAVCANGPWLSDNLLPKDSDGNIYTGSDDESWGLDMDILALESELQRLREQNMDINEMNRHLDNLSCGTSVASSECSEELSIDIEADEFGIDVRESVEGHLFTADFPSSIMNMFDDTDIAESIVLDGIDWSENSELKSVSPGLPDIEARTTSRKTPSLDNLMNRKWSKLSVNEQLAVIEHLSRLISSQLGLREQLEVIRLINPTAKVSPTDTEFVINIESIDEEKFQKIQTFVKLRSRSCCESESNHKSSPQKKQAKKQRSQERRNQLKQHTQRQKKKEQRQIQKEKRSGLFVREEVMSLSFHEADEETVDVLG